MYRPGPLTVGTVGDLGLVAYMARTDSTYMVLATRRFSLLTRTCGTEYTRIYGGYGACSVRRTHPRAQGRAPAGVRTVRAGKAKAAWPNYATNGNVQRCGVRSITYVPGVSRGSGPTIGFQAPT